MQTSKDQGNYVLASLVKIDSLLGTTSRAKSNSSDDRIWPMVRTLVTPDLMGLTLVTLQKMLQKSSFHNYDIITRYLKLFSRSFYSHL